MALTIVHFTTWRPAAERRFLSFWSARVESHMILCRSHSPSPLQVLFSSCIFSSFNKWTNIIFYVFFFKLICIGVYLLYNVVFLLDSKVNQLYVSIYPPLFGLPFHLGHHRALSSLCCRFSLVICFIHSVNNVCMLASIFPCIPSTPTQQILMEHLSDPGHCFRHWGNSYELDRVSVLMQFSFQ